MLVIIDARFNGPPASGNGGYSAGVFASAALGTSPAVVTLRLPPPLDTELAVSADGVVRAGERVIAEVAPAEPTPVGAPAAVAHEAAAKAMTGYAGFVDHPFPTCYVCGPERADGLRIFPGPLPDGRTAAIWRVPADVSRATVWAALDCPGGWAVLGPGRPYVLGRMTARVLSVPAPGSECVVVGEALGLDGRKASVRTALYSSAGTRARLLAAATATWIAI
jgi:hypothetical protein